MTTMLFVGREHGITLLKREGDTWKELRTALTGRHITSVTAQQHVLLAGARDGIVRSSDDGQTWWEVEDAPSPSHIRWITQHPDDADWVYAGTEPAAIFVSEDGGRHWDESPEVADLRDRHGWWLPYSPEAGCVRGFAFHGLRGYAAVEQGGLLRSEDRGQHWRLVEGSRTDDESSALHPDVHSVEVHPSTPDRVFAPTGGGLFYSTDGGEGWEQLYDCYCRAVWLDPGDRGHFILGPADGVDKMGRIEETIDNGKTWEPVMDGVTGPWSDYMVERFVQVENRLLAVLSDGSLLDADLDDLVWKKVLPDAQRVTSVAAFFV